nr:MAG TPA: protein of unknown function (DUF4538) [Caudoviricetes sp.]
MNTAIVGVLGSFVGIILKATIDLCVERYKKAQETKEARDNLEADLRRQILVWREHAYAVRVVALKSGVNVEELPSLPKED